MIAEVGVKVVTTGEQRLPATVAWILGKTGVVADGSSHLSRLVVTAKGCTSRYADESVGLDAMFHHDIYHACRP